MSTERQVHVPLCGLLKEALSDQLHRALGDEPSGLIARARKPKRCFAASIHRGDHTSCRDDVRDERAVSTQCRGPAGRMRLYAGERRKFA